jgi:formamidopyrimidine-DNA glycosylase
MFELPEYMVLAEQIHENITGKTVRTGNLGNAEHKFVWHNLTNDEFTSLVEGKVVEKPFVRGRWLFIPLDPGYILLLGECGGKLLYHQPGASLPKKYHLYLEFEDGTSLTETTRMWGAMELYEGDEAWEREYVKDMRSTPLDEAFTQAYFNQLIDEAAQIKKTSVKGLLTQDQLIPGLGNASAQYIMFNAKLHPKQDITKLIPEQKQALYHSILEIVQAIIVGGGRNDEYNLMGEPGGYTRIMDKNAAGNPCPVCGTMVEKISYLGGACYLCPECQKIG